MDKTGISGKKRFQLDDCNTALRRFNRNGFYRFKFIRQWRNLDGEQQKYLIQINPPADIIPEVIRSIVRAQNITDAGILFDDSFSEFLIIQVNF